MIDRLREQSGSAMVVAMLVMLVMLMASFGLAARVDSQQGFSRDERTRESAFNVSEAALNSEIFLLARNWPANASGALPSKCTNTAGGAGCPDAGEFAKNFKGPDVPTGYAWATMVRDNGGTVGSYYTDAGAVGQPSWDSNGDGEIWVRAQASAKGRQRDVAVLVAVEEVVEAFPRNVITAGTFSTASAGRKVMVDSRGAAAQPTPLAVRCTSAAPSPCLNYYPAKGQVSPDTVQTGYTGNALSPDAIDRLRERAKALGSYFSSCPPSLTGTLVFVEAGACSYTGSITFNSQGNPGAVVIASGTLAFSGAARYYGVLYLPNLQNSSGTVLSLTGNAHVTGAVAVDGPGGVVVGNSGRNLVYDDVAFSAVRSFGGAGMVQKTWRELKRSPPL